MGIRLQHGDISAMSGPRSNKIDVNKGRGLPLIVSAKVQQSTSRVSSNTVLEKLPRKDRARRTLVDTLAAKRPILAAPSMPSVDLALLPGKRPSGSDVTFRRRETSRSRDLRSGNLEGQRGGVGTQHSDASPKHCTSSLDIRYGSKASFAYTQIRDTTSEDSDNGHHPSEDVVKMANGWDKSKRTKTDSTQRWVKSQPITPKLIEKLNKMKVSSRIRTEEWVKQIPTEKRSYHSSLYKLGNVINEGDETSPVSYDSWIYEEIRK